MVYLLSQLLIKNIKCPLRINFRKGEYEQNTFQLIFSLLYYFIRS